MTLGQLSSKKSLNILAVSLTSDERKTRNKVNRRRRFCLKIKEWNKMIL